MNFVRNNYCYYYSRLRPITMVHIRNTVSKTLYSIGVVPVYLSVVIINCRLWNLCKSYCLYNILTAKQWKLLVSQYYVYYNFFSAHNLSSTGNSAPIIMFESNFQWQISPERYFKEVIF